MERRSIYDWICRLKCWKEMIPPNIPFISGCEIPNYKHHLKFAWRKQLSSQSCPSTLYTPKTQPSVCVPTKSYTICFHQCVWDELRIVSEIWFSEHLHIRIHVWYIYLHLVDFYGKCRWIYHTWILWVHQGSIDMPMLSHEGKSERAIDGNTAAAHVAYAMSSLAEKIWETVCVLQGVFFFVT